MKNLTLINKNGVFYADSRQVAEMTEKRHDHLVRDIDGYVAILGQNPKLGDDKNRSSQTTKLRPGDFFIESTYSAGTGKSYKCYLLTRKGCDMVANKMTGEKGVLFTATYVTQFEEMENQLKSKKVDLLETKQREVESKLRNSKVHEANTYLKIAKAYGNHPKYQEVLYAKAAEALSGKLIIALPEAGEKTYSATEMGLMFGVSARRIGILANEHKLKIPEYGKLFISKSEHSVKEVETWRYYESTIPVFARLLGKVGAAI